jgi:hypothetical protein
MILVLNILDIQRKQMKKYINWDILPKPYHRRYKENIGRHGLMIVKEHHGSHHLHIENEKALATNILSLLTAWVGYYIYEPKSFKLKEPEISQEKAKELPKQYQELAMQEWKEYNRAKQDHQMDVDLWNLVQDAIKNKNYTNALIAFDQVTMNGDDPGFEFIEMS